MNAPVAEPALQPARWRFGDTELDEFRLEIIRGDEVIAVEAKSLELLRAFVRHPGEVLTKDELMDAVWPGRVLSESVLARSVSLLRRAIGDGAQTTIRTVHGYGYRFDAAVERLTPVRTQSPATLHLRAGDAPPMRPNWRLGERLGEGRNETWLVEHEKTRERRVFKFAGDGTGLSTLKREITLQRLLQESLGERVAAVTVLDWNLQEAPYFIETEWCPCGSLERWLGEHPQTPVAARIELVAQAAEALAAAHGVGVLHKDVKPTNLLIVEKDGVPAVRLADFGSGVLIDDTRLAALSITRLGLTRDMADGDSSGSLMYLAPEVIAGQPATLKSDVYALGVLLYQLIVGDLRRPLAPGWERDVDDPLLRDDIARAAELDPARRLGDAAALAERLRTLDARRRRAELERADALLVEAGRRQRERWRAQRGWIAAAFATLTVGLAISSWLYADARHARDAARRAESASLAVNRFLLDDVLAATDPELSGRPDISVRELLQVAAAKVGDRLQDQPAIEASVRHSLGTAMLGLGLAADAESQFHLGLARLGDDANRHARLAADLHLQIGRYLMDVEQFTNARNEIEQALSLATGASYRTAALGARLELARLTHLDNHPDDALRAADALVPEINAGLADNNPLQARLRRYRAELLCDLSRIDDCIDAARDAVVLNLKLYPATHPEVLLSRRIQATALMRAGRNGEARIQLDALLADARAALGAEHRLTLTIAQALAITLQTEKQYAAARALFEQTLAAQVRTLGAQHTDTQVSRTGLAYLLHDIGDDPGALAIYRDVLAVQTAKFGERDSQVLVAMHNVARTLQDLGQWPEALELQRRAMAIDEDIYGKGDHWLHATIASALARTLDKLGHDDEAESLQAAAIAEFERIPGLDPRYLNRARGWQAEMSGAR